MADRSEEQFIHLVRLAWELRTEGVGVAVQLPRGQEPFIEVPRAIGPLRVRASMRSRKWIFSWGHGRHQWIYALDEGAPLLILQLAHHDNEITPETLDQRTGRWFFVR